MLESGLEVGDEWGKRRLCGEGCRLGLEACGKVGGVLGSCFEGWGLLVCGGLECDEGLELREKPRGVVLDEVGLGGFAAGCFFGGPVV